METVILSVKMTMEMMKMTMMRPQMMRMLGVMVIW